MTEAAKRYDVAGTIRSYTARCEAPEMLRQIADDIEATDGVLVGLWSTGFGRLDELVIQVVLDTATDPSQGER